MKYCIIILFLWSCIQSLPTIGNAIESINVDVDVWDPPFNQDMSRRTENYEWLTTVSKPYRICVSIPHLKDEYWIAVNWALVEQAKRLGVTVHFYSAGGYANIEKQQQQIMDCINNHNIDGLILGAVHQNQFNDIIKYCKTNNIPVIDLINGVNSPDISAKVAVSYWELGYQAGLYLKNHSIDLEKEIRVAWFPGPKGPGWTSAGNKGFRDALQDTNIQIVATKYGDTGRNAQAILINEVLDEFENLDYIVGTTVSVESAVTILRTRNLTNEIDLISYYYGPGVHRGIKRGFILSAPTDQTSLQSRLSLDVLVRILEGKPYLKHIAPKVITIDREVINNFNFLSTLFPMGFRPLLSVNDK